MEFSVTVRLSLTLSLTHLSQCPFFHSGKTQLAVSSSLLYFLHLCRYSFLITVQSGNLSLRRAVTFTILFSFSPLYDHNNHQNIPIRISHYHYYIDDIKTISSISYWLFLKVLEKVILTIQWPSVPSCVP